MPVYVDIPDPVSVGTPEGYWRPVGVFPDKRAAIEWIREHIDSSCDDEGRVCLVTDAEETTEISLPQSLRSHPS